MSQRPGASAFVLLAGIALGAAAYPRPEMVAPEWHVSVVDDHGDPLPATKVYESWQEFSFEREGHDATVLTDANGAASFPPRVINSNWAQRNLGCAWQVMRSLVHASCGPHAFVFAVKNGYGEAGSTPYAESTWDGGRQAMDTHIRLRRCPAGKTGIGCSSDAAPEGVQ